MTYREMSEELQAALGSDMPVDVCGSGKTYLEQEKELFRYCRDAIYKTYCGVRLFLEEDPANGMHYNIYGTVAGYRVEVGYIARVYAGHARNDCIEVCLYEVDWYGQEDYEKAILLMAKKKYETSIHWNSVCLKAKEMEIYRLKTKLKEEQMYLEDIGHLLSK